MQFFIPQVSLKKLLHCLIEMFLIFDDSLFIYFGCQQMQLELLMSTTGLDKEVCELVEYIWKEAVGELQDIIAVPIKSIKTDQVDGSSLDDTSIIRLLHRCDSLVKILQDC